MRSAPGDADGPTLAIDRRRAALVVVLAVLLAGAAFTVLGQAARIGHLEHALANADTAMLAACVAGQLLSYLGYTFAYRAAARASGGPCFDYPTTVRIVILGAGTSVLGASVGGLAVDFWALRRNGIGSRVAARRILAVGTLEWTILSGYAFLAALLALLGGLHVPLGMALGWLLAVPACTVGAIWCSSPSRVDSLINPHLRPAPEARTHLRRCGAWLTGKLRTGLGDAISGVVLVRHLLAHPIRYYGAAIGYPIYWAGDMLVLYFGIRMFGADPGPIALVLAYATGFVVSSLPLPAGGAGGVEATIALALHATGVPWTAALLGVFVYRLLTFWLPTIPALALLPSIRRLSDRLASAPRTERAAAAPQPLRKAMS